MSYSSQPQMTTNYDYRLENESNIALSFWKRNRVLMTSTAIGILIPSLLFTFFVFEPKFTTNASVLIKDSAIKAKFVTIDEVSTTSSPAANPVLNTVELLRSPIVRDNLWNQYIFPNREKVSHGRFKDYTEWAKFFNDGSKIIKYNNPPGTDVIQLKLDWNDPVIARDIMSNILASFQEASRELNKKEHRDRYEDVQGHIKTVRNQLADVRMEIATLKAKHGVVDIDNELVNYAKYHLDFKMAAAIAKADSMQNSQRLAAYRRTMGMSTGNAVKAVGIGLNKNIQTLHENLYKQNEELSNLSARYTDENPKVIELKQAIEQTKADIASESKRMGYNNTVNTPVIADEARGKSLNEMMDADSQAAGSLRRSSQLGRELSQFESRMSQLPAVERNLKQLADQELSLSSSLKALEDKSLDEQIREEQTVSNVFVIRPAELPLSPGAPTRTHMIILSFLISLVGAALAVRIRSHFSKVQTIFEHQVVSPNNNNGLNGTVTSKQDELVKV